MYVKSYNKVSDQIKVIPNKNNTTPYRLTVTVLRNSHFTFGNTLGWNRVSYLKSFQWIFRRNTSKYYISQYKNEMYMGESRKWVQTESLRRGLLLKTLGIDLLRSEETLLQGHIYLHKYTTVKMFWLIGCKIKQIMTWC